MNNAYKRYCLGGLREWGTPVPIPNTEVKPLIADVTSAISAGKVGRRQDNAFYFCLKIEEKHP